MAVMRNAWAAPQSDRLERPPEPTDVYPREMRTYVCTNERREHTDAWAHSVVTHSLEYYSARKRDKVPIPPSTWMRRASTQ